MTQSHWQWDDSPGESCTGKRAPDSSRPVPKPPHALTPHPSSAKGRESANARQRLPGRWLWIDTSVNGKTVMAKNCSAEFA